jgi:DNA-directed RNA polymerase specialized sigma24 family protein
MGKAGMERQILLQKIEEAVADCSERDRQIFWLHHRQGFTAQEIASIPHFKLGTKGMESVIHRLTKHVRRKLADPP